MTNLSWSTAADHDAAQSDENTHHEQPTGTDWAPADTIELGYQSNVSQVGATLAAYYPLAASSGTTAYEVSGNGTDGTINGMSLLGDGILGKNAGSFDGVDDYVDTNSIYGTHGGNFGVSAWVIQNGWSSSYENVFNNWDGGDGWALQRDGSSQYISFYTSSSSGNRVAAVTDIVDGNWHHVHGQCDLNNTMEIFIDGTSDNSGSIGGHNPDLWNANHWIGAEPGDTNANNPSGTNFWGGVIAHVMVWHGLLTSSEIATLADPAAGIHTSSVQTS